jgi:hypothetical protein
MDADNDGGGGLAKGSKVEAKYRGGSRYYKGKITRKRLNGTFDILYDDGEKEMGVDKSLIKSLGGDGGGRRGMDTDDDDGGGLAEGSKVEAKYRCRSRYYKGKITRKRLNGTFDILYDDGEQEMGVDKLLIKSLGGGEGGGQGASSDSEGRSRGGGGKLGEGDKVEVKYRGGSRYYKGKITRERLNGTFDILYDDGEKEMGVSEEMVRAVGGSSGGGDGFTEGDKIEARYRGASRYYKGKINRERQNGTFDILYDDGEKEMGVDAALIRKAVSSNLVRMPRFESGGGMHLLPSPPPPPPLPPPLSPPRYH